MGSRHTLLFFGERDEIDDGLIKHIIKRNNPKKLPPLDTYGRSIFLGGMLPSDWGYSSQDTYVLEKAGYIKEVDPHGFYEFTDKYRTLYKLKNKQ